MAARYFEFVGKDGRRGTDSSKFWEARVVGAMLTVRYGPIGAAGTTIEKSFATPAETRAEAEKLIASKLKKGYFEVAKPTNVGAKKAPAKKTPAKKTPAKKTPAKKTPAKKTPAKKTSDLLVRKVGDKPQSPGAKRKSPPPAGTASQSVVLTFPLFGGRGTESVEGTPVDVSPSGSGVYRIEEIPLCVGVGLGDLVHVKVARGRDELTVTDVVARSPRFTLGLTIDVPAGASLNTTAAPAAWAKAIARRVAADAGLARSSARRTAVCCPESVADGAAALAWAQLMSTKAFEEVTPRQQAQLRKLGAFTKWDFCSVPRYGPGRPPGLARGKIEPLFAQEPVTVNRLRSLPAKGESLLSAGDRDGALAALAVQAQQGAPPSLASFMWKCMEAGEFDRALMLATWSIDACVDFTESCDDDPSLSSRMPQEVANVWSNIALSRCALDDASRAVDAAWAKAHGFGLIEPSIHPAIALLREGNAVEARKSIYLLGEEAPAIIRGELESMVTTSVGWLKAWVKDGLRIVRSLRKSEGAQVRRDHVQEQAERVATESGVVARKLGSLYLGGACFSAYDPSKRTSKANSSPRKFITFETGFDCWANVSSLHASAESDKVVGVVIVTYSDWVLSREGKKLQTKLEDAKIGQVVNLAAVLAHASRAEVVAAWGETGLDDCIDSLTTLECICLESGMFPEGLDESENPADRKNLVVCGLVGKISGYGITPHFLLGTPDQLSEQYDDDDEEYEDVCIEGPIVLVNPSGQKLLGIPKPRW